MRAKHELCGFMNTNRFLLVCSIYSSLWSFPHYFLVVATFPLIHYGAICPVLYQISSTEDQVTAI